MSQLIALSSPPESAELETATWLKHWRLSSSVMLLSGLLLLVSGVGLCLCRRKAILLLAAVALFLVLLDLTAAATGWARYAFESPEPLEIAFLVLVATSCIVAYRRWRLASHS
jgi:hypothetical protein